MEPVVRVATADSVDAVELAAVAARTFPLACPPSVAPDDIASFIDANLSTARFADYLADPQRLILTTNDDDRITGYAMLISGVSDDPDIQRAVHIEPAVELSKMYVLPAHHGSGVAAALMEAALSAAAAGVRNACGSASTRKTNVRNASTTSMALSSVVAGLFGWAAIPKATM